MSDAETRMLDLVDKVATGWSFTERRPDGSIALEWGHPGVALLAVVYPDRFEVEAEDGSTREVSEAALLLLVEGYRARHNRGRQGDGVKHYSDAEDYPGDQTWPEYVQAKAEALGLGTVDAWHDIDSVGILLWRSVERVQAEHSPYTLSIEPRRVAVVSRVNGAVVRVEHQGTRLEGALSCLEWLQEGSR